MGKDDVMYNSPIFRREQDFIVAEHPGTDIDPPVRCYIPIKQFKQMWLDVRNPNIKSLKKKTVFTRRVWRDVIHHTAIMLTGCTVLKKDSFCHQIHKAVFAQSPSSPLPVVSEMLEIDRLVNLPVPPIPDVPA